MSTYDWKKTAIKGLKSGLIVFLTGILALYAKDARLLAFIPLIKMGLNYLKHK